MTPHSLVTKIQKKISSGMYFSFLSALILGLLTHFFILTNYLPNWDGFNNFYSSQNTIGLGRCFLTVACGISSYYDLPWINGMLSLLYLSIISVLVSESLHITGKVSRILISGLLVSFPVITSTFAYMYTADGYCLALLFMTIAVYISVKYRKGWLISIPFICFAFGCYQASICFALSYALVYSINELQYRNTTHKEILIKWGKLFLSVFCGFLLYFGVCKLLLTLQNSTLASYQGISSAGLFSPFLAIKKCVVDFAYFFIGSVSAISFYSLLNVAILIILLVTTIIQIFQTKLYRKPFSFILLILSYVLIPFACFAIYFISGDVQYHTLMQGGLFFVYVLFIISYQSVFQNKLFKHHQWFVLCLSAITIFYFIIVANICYQKQNLSYKKSMNIVDSIAQRIQEVPESSNIKKIIVIGHLSDNEPISIYMPPEMVGFSDQYLMTSSVHYANILNDYYGYHFEAVPESESSTLTSLYSSISAWPQNGSIVISEDTLIINLGN